MSRNLRTCGWAFGTTIVVACGPSPAPESLASRAPLASSAPHLMDAGSRLVNIEDAASEPTAWCAIEKGQGIGRCSDAPEGIGCEEPAPFTTTSCFETEAWCKEHRAKREHEIDECRRTATKPTGLGRPVYESQPDKNTHCAVFGRLLEPPKRSSLQLWLACSDSAECKLSIQSQDTALVTSCLPRKEAIRLALKYKESPPDPYCMQAWSSGQCVPNSPCAGSQKIEKCYATRDACTRARGDGTMSTWGGEKKTLGPCAKAK